MNTIFPKIISYLLCFFVLACQSSKSDQGKEGDVRAVAQAFANELIDALNDDPTEARLSSFFQNPSHLPTFLWEDSPAAQSLEFSFNKENAEVGGVEGGYVLPIPFLVKGREREDIDEAGTWLLFIQEVSDGTFAVTRLKNRDLGRIAARLIGLMKESETSPDEAPITLLDSAKYFARTLEEKYDAFIYFLKHDGNFIYYVANGDVNAALEKEERNHGHFKMGLVNQHGQEIIPLAFDEIYNPEPNLGFGIQVEKDGQFGYYDLAGNQLLPVQYDGLFPYPQDPEVIFQVRQGEQYGWIDSEWQVHLDPVSHIDKKLFTSPLNSSLYSNLSFVVEEKKRNIILLKDMTGSWSEQHGTVIYPPYIRHLGIWTHSDGDFLDNVNSNEHGTLSVGGGIELVKNLGGKLKVLFSRFQSEGIDVRTDGFYDEKVITVDENLEPVEQMNVTEFTYSEPYYCSHGGMRFVRPDLMEFWGDQYLTGHPKYFSMTTYRYYEVTEDGRYRILTNDRQFPFTKYIDLEERYFQDCYRLLEGFYDEDTGGQIVLSRHLSINDLDVMRNEIFAEYGYQFKSKRWQDYFSGKQWYRAKFDNVDDMMSERDKKNVEFIRSYQERMRENPSLFISRDTVPYAAAG